MKKYFVFSTLSFTWVFFLIELIMSTDVGFTTFANFNWFISPSLLYWTNIVTWLVQGLALSFAAYLYMTPEDKLAGGFRFGLITGLLFSLLALFNMMWQIDHNSYGFFAESLLPLTGLYVLGFAISGWFFGLMFEVFSPEFPTIKKLWSVA